MTDIVKINIPVTDRHVNDELIKTCSGRILHAELAVKKDYTSWAKAQIKRGRFVEGRDYLLTQEGEQLPSGTKWRTEYHFTVDAAKHIGMMSGTERGFEVREHFIERERFANGLAAQPRITYSVGKTDTLTAAEADELRDMLTAGVKALPHSDQAKAMMQGWAKLKAHFKVTYRQIPRAELPEALSIVARHLTGYEAQPLALTAQMQPDQMQKAMDSVHMLAASAPARATEQKSSPSESGSAAAAAPHKDVTDTVIRLKVRPVGSRYFKPELLPAAQYAGFEYVSRGKTHAGSLAVVDRDTSEAIAVIGKPDGFGWAVGQVNELDIVIDPVNGPIEWQAGSRIATACVKFATAMCGALFDANDQPVNDAAAEAIAQQINAVMWARQRQAMEEAVVTELPDGTRRRAQDISFHSSIYTARGRHLEYRYFDVEPMSLYEGEIKGFEMAREMLTFMMNHKVRAREIYLDRTVRSALSDCKQSGGPITDYHGKSVGNVASGFLNCIEGMLHFAAKNANFDEWIDKKVAELKGRAEYFAQQETKRKANFAELGKAGAA